MSRLKLIILLLSTKITENLLSLSMFTNLLLRTHVLRKTVVNRRAPNATGACTFFALQSTTFSEI